MKSLIQFSKRMGVVALLCLSFSAGAQNESAWLTTLSSADSAAINALALYPDSIRLSIFEACKYPEVIVRVSMLQQKTSGEFIQLLSAYSRQEQDELWDLTRYPGLIEKLAAGESKSKDEINQILAAYPNEIHDVAMKYARNHPELLQSISVLYTRSSDAFDRILKDYPPSVHAAVNDLIELPEALSILNDHMQMTVLVGDMFRKNQAQLIRTVDSLNLVLARQNAEDLEAWKQMVQNDPNLQNDLIAAAEDYAAENGYSAQEYSQTPTSTYIDHYIVYPYPYWFGYPYWYPYYYWYPYPYWFDWGFYLDPFGAMFVFGFPSYYFSYWYFYYPPHYYHYPYLCNSYVSYYYGPRNVVTQNTNIVRDWVNEKSRYLPADFTANSSKHLEAIKQLGQFETDFDKYRLQTPSHTITKDEFLKKNEPKYQKLNVPPKAMEGEKTRTQLTQVQKAPPVKQPQVRIPEVARELKQKEGVPPAKEIPLKFDFGKVNPALEHHRTTWEQSTPKQQPVQRSHPAPKQPAPRTEHKPR
jgi:hypothetical protein